MKLRRITLEEAKKYVPYTDDFSGAEREYFTLHKDPEDIEWDIVTYYTSRKEDLYVNREGDGDSWVYILSNPSFPNLIKIGSTGKQPEERAKQISRGTGVPTEFEVEFAFRCFNAEALEMEIHKYLRSKRIRRDREFFQMEISEAITSIKSLGKKYL